MGRAVGHVAGNDLASVDVGLALEAPGEVAENKPEIEPQREQKRTAFEHSLENAAFRDSASLTAKAAGPTSETVAERPKARPSEPMKKKAK